MIVRWLVLAMVAGVGADAARAGCSVAADPGAVVRRLDMAQEADSHLLASMAMLPKLMHLDYAGVAKNKPSCGLGQFTVGQSTYELDGEDKPGRQRKAFPATKNDPIAVVVPVFDIIKAVEASKQGKSAPVEGYLLATVTRINLTGWRYYTGMPDETVLKHDMAEALGGGAPPIFRQSSDGKTEVFVTK